MKAAPPPVTLSPEAEGWLAGWQSALVAERRRAARTIEAYGRDARAFLIFLTRFISAPLDAEALHALDLSSVRAWLADLATTDHAPTSRARALAALRQFFAHLMRMGVVEANPFTRLSAPRLPEPLPRTLSEREAAALMEGLQEAAPVEAALFTLLYGTGLRLGEALALDLGDLEAGEYLRVVGKGSRERQVPLLPPIRTALQRYAASRKGAGRDAPLFVGVQGGRLNPGVAQAMLRRLRARLGLPAHLTPHALRHSFATHILMGGGDIRSIQELLGHSQLSTTQRYTALTDARRAAVFRAAHPRARLARTGEE